ncbi:MAG TPA: hypothetical protein VGC41_11035 [Kofleriaceae bacterium]
MLDSSSEGNPLSFTPPTTPDPAPEHPEPRLVFRESSNLDGTYLWLGPAGAATHIDAEWDTVFGIDAAIVRVREHEPLAVIGGSVSATHYAARSGGRVSVDVLAATELAGHAIGISAGPMLELSDFSHPHVGGSVGLWGFAGIAPYARLGTVESLGSFVEIGIHVALPVIRR